MPIELKQHFVAFLDVLGFKEMVRSDVASGEHLFLSKLFRCHQSAAGIFQDDPACSITQFSDSIVVSKPFDPDRLDPHHPIVVSKPNVTTGRTANASQKRRKQDATFICPVPGCGSTFTRSFNLKGKVF